MLSYRILACVFGTVLVLSADVASAAHLSRKVVLPDEGGHLTRREHEASCERRKTSCLANYNRFSARNSHERGHCMIAFNQCLRQ